METLPKPIIIRIMMPHIATGRLINRIYRDMLHPHWVSIYVEKYVNNTAAITAAMNANTLSRLQLDKILRTTSSTEIVELIKSNYTIYVDPQLIGAIGGSLKLTDEMLYTIFENAVKHNTYHMIRIAKDWTHQTAIAICNTAIKHGNPGVFRLVLYAMKSTALIDAVTIPDSFLKIAAKRDQIMFHIIIQRIGMSRRGLLREIFANNKINLTDSDYELLGRIDTVTNIFSDIIMQFIKRNDYISFYNFIILNRYMFNNADVGKYLETILKTGKFKMLKMMIQAFKKIGVTMDYTAITDHNTIKMLCDYSYMYKYNVQYITDTFNSAIIQLNADLQTFVLGKYKKHAIIMIANVKTLEQLATVFHCVERGAQYNLDKLIAVYARLKMLKPVDPVKQMQWNGLRARFYDYLIGRYPNVMYSHAIT